MAGEVAGEELPGPILSIMSAKPFGRLFLFHTPHTRENAAATEKEVSGRYPECQIVVHELPVSDPQDYSSVMGSLARTVRGLMKQMGLSEIADLYVCVSSGTAEMRAAWLILAALEFFPARFLQVGSLARPLFAEANVKLGRGSFKGGLYRLFGGVPIPGLDDVLQELGIYVGSAVLRHAAERAAIAAGSDLPVIVLGETGTGKEQFARLIHRMSSRGSHKLVPINCAAIPESIAEDHLFGHMKGAFSGAHSDKEGMFENADQSTLFLDEIAELTLEVQAKLLGVIQDGVIQRLGSTAPRKVDVRIIAASNRDLRHEVSAGRFREDLYFRLEVVQIKLPALRERRSEIPELALALLRRINLRRSKPRQLSSDALMRLEQYDWPGNVRQLSNVLERSVLYARGDVIQAEALHITEDPPPKDPLATLPEPCQGFKLDEYLAHLREQLIVRALAACKGNQTEAAKLLGISKQAVSKSVARQRELTSRKP